MVFLCFPLSFYTSMCFPGGLELDKKVFLHFSKHIVMKCYTLKSFPSSAIIEFCQKQFVKLSHLCITSSKKFLSHLSVAVLHRQPPVIGKLIFAAGLNIAEDDGSQEPGGVVPDTWGYLS